MSGETEKDPSGLSVDNLNNQVDRSIKAERDWVASQLEVAGSNLDVIRERLKGIDRATALFQESLIRVPTDVDKQVGNLKLLHEEKFKSVALQFEERDKRGERESRDNKVAVDAAFAAQKEAASEQNKSNTLAISKSEAATAETINKLEQLVSANIGGLNDKVDDLKATAAALRQELIAVTNSLRQEMVAFQARTEAIAAQRVETKADTRSQREDYRATIAIVVAVVAVIASVVFGIYAATGR